MRFNVNLVVLSAAICLVGRTSAADFSAEDLEFFERDVRPLLVENCYECHSGDSRTIEAGLLLDHRDQILDGGDSGPAVVVGDPDSSMIIQAIRYEGSEMPPDRKLSEAQIGALVKWVKIGVPWPAGSIDVPQPLKNESIDWPMVRDSHWAWRNVVRPILPVGDDSEWSLNEIDRFVSVMRDRIGLTPAPVASRRVLIRRLYFDLLGVPPTPEEVDCFVEDETVNAYERLVDQLLASPLYGERWGRHWLDVARYSDGFGSFNDGGTLPNAFRFRDWVVKKLNIDQPYGEFVRHQIAGDQIDAPEAAIGTGFFAIGPSYNSDGGDPDSIAQAKSETLDDRVDTMSRAFLGLTVACARCHDHKFDPVPTLDYYSLAGVFNNSRVSSHPLATKEVVDQYNKVQAAIKEVEQQIKSLNNTAQKENRELTEPEKQILAEHNAELKTLRENAPQRYPECHALSDAGSDDMHVALRGNLRKPGPVAPRRFLHVLSRDVPAPFEHGSGRLELANSIATAENPLTARVIVNRLWQHHFGTGIVATASNFGSLVEPPSHPELLDWLASELMANDWSLKYLHRKILLTATFRMSSRHDDASFAIDGDNRYLWRVSPRRLDVESWRDALLSVTGEIDSTIGGPPVDQLFASRRRTLYAKISRSGDQFQYDEFLRNFDFPTPRASHAKRTTSTVPQQYLFMMNSQFMVDRAKAFVARLENEASTTEERIQRAYLLLYSRPVTGREISIGLAFLANAIGETGLTKWQQYAQALLSSNEFMYIQ